VLVLSRKLEQSLILGDDVTITVLGIEGDRVKLGIDAPRSVTVLRQEVYQQIRNANYAAAANELRPSVHNVTAVIRRRDATPAK
jgi:carbon storage regulator